MLKNEVNYPFLSSLSFCFEGRALGLRSTTDPLFQIEKVFDKVKYMDTGMFEILVYNLYLIDFIAFDIFDVIARSLCLILRCISVSWNYSLS